ncbi:MAG TPA: YceI family protein [Parafilimonas sp.]|nr:YceI family protein [Parafilimonas sp.]
MYKAPVKYVRILFVFVSVIAATGFRQQPSIYQTTNGQIAFRSDAPLETIKAVSNDLIGLLDINKKNFSFKIDVHSFKGFNSPLQKEHFNENYMESDKYPYASFSGKIIEDVDLSVDGTYEVRAKGNLLIHNVTQERIIKSNITVKKNVITVNSGFTVLLSEHDIPIPKVVYQKLADEIKVEVNATFEPR